MVSGYIPMDKIKRDNVGLNNLTFKIINVKIKKTGKSVLHMETEAHRAS